MASRSAPAPGEAPMPAPNAPALLRRNAREPDRGARPAIHFPDQTWSHPDYLPEPCRWANLFPPRRDEGRPFHVAALLDTTPDYLFALGGAALAGATVVGLNHPRQGEHLARDVRHTDVGLLVTEPRHQPTLEPILDDLGLGADRLLVSTRFPDTSGDAAPTLLGEDLDDALASVATEDPGLEPDPETRWALIFTSGTSSAPKAVICTQRRLMVTGTRMGMLMDLGPDDIG